MVWSGVKKDETPLLGGNVNGAVVQVGHTVRRRMSAASPTIHRLLLHLEAKGFGGSPRFLGIDDQQREILTFLPGETGIPPTIWQSDQPLVATAQLLRAYHDATVDFVVPHSATWANAYPDPARHQVICHNDFAPYNFVYTDGIPDGIPDGISDGISDGIPTGVIDFDLAGPGPRLRDVAYAAYWLVPLSFNSADQHAFAEADVRDGSRRLLLFCQNYGCQADCDLFDMIADVLARMGSEEEMHRIVGGEAAARLKAEGHLAHWQAEARAFEGNRVRIETNVWNWKMK